MTIRHRSRLRGQLAVAGPSSGAAAVVGTPDSQTEVRFARIDPDGAYVSLWAQESAQVGNDNHVFKAGYNVDQVVAGILGFWDGWETGYDPNNSGGGTDVIAERHVGEIFHPSDSDLNRRWLTCAYNLTSGDLVGGFAGEVQFANNDRSATTTTIVSGQVRSTGYYWLLANNAAALVCTNANQSTFTAIAHTAGDKLKLSFSSAADGDGEINGDTAFRVKAKIGSTTVTALEVTAGYCILADTNNWNGVYIRNGATGGDGVVVEVGSSFGLQITKVSGAIRIGAFGGTPAIKQLLGAAFTNNIASGGSTGVVANYTDLTTYANDAATIRNNLYRLAERLINIEAKLVASTWFGTT